MAAKKTSKKTTQKTAPKTTAKTAPKTTKKASAKAAVKSPAKKTAAKVKAVVKKVTGKKVPAKKVAAKKVTKAKAATAYSVTVGSVLPQVAGKLTSNAAFSTQNLKNKTVVLYFYPKDNTPGCTLEGQDFRRLHAKFHGAGVEIIGVSQDTVASHEKFKTKCDFPFELLSDESGEVCKAFDVIQMKSMYGKDFLGIERSTFIVKNGVIKAEWRKVKVLGHADEVLNAVKAL